MLAVRLLLVSGTPTMVSMDTISNVGTRGPQLLRFRLRELLFLVTVVSCAVLGTWIAFLAGSFGAIARHDWRQAHQAD
jgi:hypothetical protein